MICQTIKKNGSICGTTLTSEGMCRYKAHNKKIVTSDSDITINTIKTTDQSCTNTIMCESQVKPEINCITVQPLLDSNLPNVSDLVKISFKLNGEQGESFYFDPRKIYLKAIIRVDSISSKNNKAYKKFYWFCNHNGISEMKSFVEQAHAKGFECHEIMWHSHCNFFIDIDLELTNVERQTHLNRHIDEDEPDNCLIGEIVDVYEQSVLKSLENNNIIAIDDNKYDSTLITRIRQLESGDWKYSMHLITNLWMPIIHAKYLAEDARALIANYDTPLDKTNLINKFDLAPYKRKASLSMVGGIKNGHENIIHNKGSLSDQYLTIYSDKKSPIINTDVYAPRGTNNASLVIDNEFVTEALKHVNKIPFWDENAFDLAASSKYPNTFLVKRLQPSYCDTCKRTHDNDNSLLIYFVPDKGIAMWRCNKSAELYKVYWRKPVAKQLIVSQEEHLNPTQLNHFSEEAYYWSDLCKHLDNSSFDSAKDNKQAVEFLSQNLPRVLSIVGEDVFIKMNEYEFFRAYTLSNFSTQLVHTFRVCSRTGAIIKSTTPLKSFLLKYKKHFKLFNSVKANFDFDTHDTNAFICSRRFIATKIDNYNTPALAILLAFIHTNIFSKNDELFEYELDKLAIMCKYPHKKTMIITILLTVLTGCGKNLYTDFLCKYLFGNHSSISNCPGIDRLLDDKNAEQLGKKLVVINEMANESGRFISNFDKLKGLVTETRQRIRSLYSNAIMVDSSTDYYACSNHKNSFHIGSIDSRREFCPDIDESYADDRKYFGPIKKAIETQDCGDAFYSFLMDRPITYEQFTAKKVPMSNTKRQVVECSMSLEQSWLAEYTTELGDLPKEIRAKDLYVNYTTWMSNNAPDTKAKSSVKLSQIILGKGIERVRKACGTVYVLK